MSQIQIRRALIGDMRLPDHRGLPGFRTDGFGALSPSAAAGLAIHPVPTLRVPLRHPAPALGQAEPRSAAAIVPAVLPPAPGSPPATTVALAVRVPRTPRPLPVPHASTLSRAVADPGLMRAVEAALLQGRLWRAIEIARLCGASESGVRSALAGLTGRGSAVHVALGHWRSRRRDACLIAHGLTPSARMLGGLLHGLSLGLADLSDILEMPEAEAASAPGDLVRHALAVEIAPETYQCPEPVRRGVIARLGPAPLTELGRRVVDALADGGPMRKSDAADAVRIGRGSANRMIDRLVTVGWVREAGSERFALA